MFAHDLAELASLLTGDSHLPPGDGAVDRYLRRPDQTIPPPPTTASSTR
jgi:hypothetical protein